MMLSNLASYALQAGVVLAVGLLAPRVLRLRLPGVAMRYWQILLVAVLVLPVIQPWREPVGGLGAVRVVGGMVVDSVATAVPVGLPWPSIGWFIGMLGFVAAIRLLWLGFGLWNLGRIRRTSSVAVGLPRSVAEIQRGLGTRATMLVSPRVTVPVTFGWLRPTVVLPTQFERLSESQQLGIACHELLHVCRRDWLTVVVEQIVRAALWFHPAVWLLLGKIALCREQLIDAEVVRMTGARKPYLEALWSMARGVDRFATLPALPLLKRSDLFHRVVLLAEEVNMSKLRLAATAVAVIASVAIAGAAVATAFPLVKSAALASMSMGPEDETSSKTSTDEDADPKSVRFVPDGDVTEPEVIFKVNPKYPEEARRARLMGVVVCETVITAEGKISDIKILRTADEVFNQPTIDALMQWEFEPATLDGEPVDVIYVLTVKYKLEKGTKDEAEKAEE